MSNVVNLNKFRKRQQRAEREESASVNRTRHGRSKAERRSEDETTKAQIRRLDGSLLEPDENAEGGDKSD